MPDVYGMIMMDAAKGLDIQYSIEGDDGFVEPDYVKNYTATSNTLAERERHALTYVNGRILDIGCGPGRVALHLQQQAYNVTGIDIPLGAVEAARMRGLNNTRVMSAEELSFPDLRFDMVLLFSNNFGLLGCEERAKSILNKLYSSTTDDAVTLADSVDPAKTDNPRHLEYHKKDREEGRPPGLVRIRLLYKGHVGDRLELWLASPQETSSVAEQAGWYLDDKIGEDGPYIGLLRKR